jgi:hypothetical protein
MEHRRPHQRLQAGTPRIRDALLPWHTDGPARGGPVMKTNAPKGLAEREDVFQSHIEMKNGMYPNRGDMNRIPQMEYKRNPQ